MNTDKVATSAAYKATHTGTAPKLWSAGELRFVVALEEAYAGYPEPIKTYLIEQHLQQIVDAQETEDGPLFV